MGGQMTKKIYSSFEEILVSDEDYIYLVGADSKGNVGFLRRLADFLK